MSFFPISPLPPITTIFMTVLREYLLMGANELFQKACAFTVVITLRVMSRAPASQALACSIATLENPCRFAAPSRGA